MSKNDSFSYKEEIDLIISWKIYQVNIKRRPIGNRNVVRRVEYD